MDVENLDTVLQESQVVAVFGFFKTQRESLYKMPDEITVDAIVIDLR